MYTGKIIGTILIIAVIALAFWNNNSEEEENVQSAD